MDEVYFNMEVKKTSSLIVYEYEELNAILQQLKISLRKLNIKRDKYLKIIDDFNLRYANEFQIILDEILKLRIKHYKKKFLSFKLYYDDLLSLFNEKKELIQELQLNNLEDDKRKIKRLALMLKNIKSTIEKLNIKDIKSNYLDAFSDYKEFKKIYKTESTHVKLAQEDEKELKYLYKKASKLCHPDIVDELKLEDAQDIFRELNEAYRNKDLKMVRDFLTFLDTGSMFKREDKKTKTKEELKNDIQKLKESYKNILTQIHDIRYENKFSFVFEIENIDEYFDSLSIKLQKQLDELRGIKTDIKENQEKWLKKLFDWANKYKIDNSTLPRDIVKLKNLKKLDLNGLELDFVCKELSNLSMLEELNLSYNKLETLPDEFNKLEKLKKLNLSNNNFTKIPSFILDVKSLISLDISANNIKELTCELNKLYMLEEFLCSRNKLTLFPEKLCFLLRLKNLDLGGNFIKNLPDEISNLKELQSLSLWGNGLVKLNDFICDLKYLQSLNLGSNQLSSLPSKIVNLENIKELELFMNNNLTLNKAQKEWEENINPSLF